MPVIHLIDNKAIVSYTDPENENRLTACCYEFIDNSWQYNWTRPVSQMPFTDYDLKIIGDKLLYAYACPTENSSRIYLKTLNVNGEPDQDENAYILPNLCNYQSKPIITVISNESAFINRMEYNNEMCKILVYDLISTNNLASDQGSAQPVKPAIYVKNYPNPFSQQTRITWLITKQAEIEIDIYNIKGQRVKRVCQTTACSGKNSLDWDSKDDSGNNLPSGIYFIRLRSEGQSTVRKMLLLK